MADKETPQSLYDFFAGMNPGDAPEGEQEIYYGSPTVLRKGLKSAAMLLAIQRVLGLESPRAGDKAAPTAGDAEVKPVSPPEGERDRALAESLAEAEEEVDRLLLQNMGLTEENRKLRERIRQYQRQIERLYARSEMSSILDRLQGHPATPAQGPGEAPPPTSEELRHEAAARAPRDEAPAAETTAPAPADRLETASLSADPADQDQADPERPG